MPYQQTILSYHQTIRSYHHIRSASHDVFQRLRLTLGDMFKNEVPKNHKNGPDSGRGGSVWAETLSKRRPEAQDHFPSPLGPKNLIEKVKSTGNGENDFFTVQSHQLYMYIHYILKTPTAGHRRTPIQFASAITAEAEAGTNAGTLERQNLRICKTCISANPAYLHNLRICKT